MLLDRGELESAAETLRRALTIEANHVTSLANLCAVLRMQGKLAEAVAMGRRAVALHPHFLTAQFNLAVALEDSGEWEESLAGFQRVLDLDPCVAEGHFALAQAYLRQGDFPRGCDEYEWRLRLPEYGWIRRLPAFTEKPRWSGETIRDKTILISAEQGLGDTLQFIRYIPRVVARARSVIFWVQPALKALLRNVEGVELVWNERASPEFRRLLPTASLPGVFATTPGDIPPVEPCIESGSGGCRALAASIGRSRFPDRRRLAGQTRRQRRSGSIDPAGHLRAVGANSRGAPDLLQKNAGVEQLAGLPDGMKVETLGEEFDNGEGAFLDTAAVMMNLDLVVASDTAIAHLAGTLGRPTWVALRRVPDWRWMLDRPDTPWYPTMRLFRQKVAGDWEGVFSEIAESVAARARGDYSSLV